MDGHRDCHTEWNKSEREKQIWCINTYMWNLEKWFRWSYLQSRNRDRCREHGYQGGNKGWHELGHWDWHIYATDAPYKIDGASQAVLGSPPANASRCKRLGLDPRAGTIPWRRAWPALQYFCLENPWTEEPGRLWSRGLQRVRYSWSDLAHTHA